MSTALNILKNTLKIFHIAKRNFFDSMALPFINKYCTGGVVQISTVLGPAYHVAFRKVIWISTFETLIEPQFLEAVTPEISQLWGSSIFSERWNIKINFKNDKKSSEKTFCFWRNWIKIVCVKLSLLRREYLSMALNILKDTLKIFHIAKRNFFDSMALPFINKYCTGGVVQISTVLGPAYHVAFRKVIWISTFETLIEPQFLEAVTPEISQLWGSSIFSERWNIKINFKNDKKSSEKTFCFWRNWIKIVCVKLSLLRREYLSMALNVLKNSC